MAGEDLYFTVSTAGHVDHGKTSVLKRLTGIDTDRLKEEKQRQMTTDLGFAHLRLESPPSFGQDVHFQVGFIDVPGHGKFLKNMIAGVGTLDMTLLVVAADQGSMPQTLQHIEILSLLRVTKVLLVMHKCDLVDKEIVDSRISEVSNLLEKYDLQMVEAVSTSCVLDSGFDELKMAIANCLASIASRTGSSLAQLPAVLPIDRAFRIIGHGLVVTGTLVRGSLRQGDSIMIEPLGAKGRVRGLQTFGRTVQVAQPGQRVAINLAVKEQDSVERGQVITDAALPTTQTVLVSMEFLLASAPSKRDIRSQPIRFYHGTAETQAFLGWAQELPGIDDPYRQTFMAQISLSDPIVAEPQERFVVRLAEERLAGGSILLKARPKWLKRSLLIEFCRLLMRGQTELAILWFAQHCPDMIFRKDSLSLFVPLESRDALVWTLLEKQQLIEIGDFLLTAQSYSDLQNQILEKLTMIETASSSSRKDISVNLEALRAAVNASVDRSIFLAAIDLLAKRGDLIRDEEKLSTAASRKLEQSVKLSEKAIADLERVISEKVCIEIDALPEICRIKSSEIEKMIRQLEREGKTKRIAHNFVCSVKALDAAHSVLGELWKEKQQITPSHFKERMNITRKYAMAMLSHFDDTQVTRRVGAGRALLKMPKG